MATIIETPATFGERAGQRIVQLKVSEQVTTGTVAERARAVCAVQFNRDDGRQGRVEQVTIAILPDGTPVPTDSDDVVIGASQSQINDFLQVAQLIYAAAIAKAEEDLTP